MWLAASRRRPVNTREIKGHKRAFLISRKDIFMRKHLKHGVWVLAIAIGFVMTGVTAQADDHDYSKNKTYQQGVREGQDDHAHNKDHSKKRHFKKDDDQKAYEAGYQKGRGN
jgi:hypothetical protein